MNKDFEKDYNTHTELKARYDTAYNNKDEAGMDKVRSEYQAFKQTIDEKGSDYIQMFNLYKEAKDRGNAYIDINDVVRNPEELIANFRKFGIEKFTFSSTWSSAVKVAWEFVKCGCKQEGIIEINGQFTEFMSNDYERVPAYVFTLA